MHKILKNAKEELKQIEETGLTTANLDTAYKLIEITKGIKKIEKLEEGEGMKGEYDDYGRNYGGYGSYSNSGYGNYSGDDYGRRGVPGSGRGRGRYRGEDKMHEHLGRINEGLEMYQMSRGRYGNEDERVYEGLEMLMFGICMFIESAMDFAESPEEKAIIRKHIQKMKNM